MNPRQKLITDYFFSPNLYWISVPSNLKKNKIDDSDKIELSEGKKQKIMQEKIEEQKQEQEQKQVKNDIIRGYNPETDSWHCSECGVDMGSINPRQLCGKYYCKSDC